MKISFVVLIGSYEEFKKGKQIIAYPVGRADGMTFTADLDDVEVGKYDKDTFGFTVKLLNPKK